ncbi:hypothetical protein O181_110381 [Austropuccinia psidii MF-1]|uniref:Uncharacterized protein n=1 Tax=Austropuccinia psidii MF-1 TaxID=1389203 RepID=A0A9Q3PRR5_9BASI|nr:hypothetical protein [Austropuccinia psidii MF-1]
MRTNNILTQLPGDLENTVKCTYIKISIIDDIENVIQDFRKKTSIGISSPYRSHDSRGKQNLLMEQEIKPTNGSEAPKRIKTFHHCGSPDHYANDFPKGKKFSIEEESVEEHIELKSDSEFTLNGLIEGSERETELIERYLLDYEGEKPESVLVNLLKLELSEPKNGKTLVRHH